MGKNKDIEDKPLTSGIQLFSNFQDNAKQVPKKVINILLHVCVLAGGYADPFILFSFSVPQDTRHVLTREFMEFKSMV